MGARSKRRTAFFAEHPVCCFCAGAAPAVEEDHQPGRVFFRNREWPEGFVFPSCAACNRVSKKSENVSSILISNTQNETDFIGYRSRVEHVRLNYPEFLPRDTVTTNRKRSVFKRLGMEKPAGVAYADPPIASIDPEVWMPELRLLGRKLFLALFYQTFGKPLPLAGGIWLEVRSNADDPNEDFIQAIGALGGNTLAPVRSTQPLVDQLDIRWSASVDPNLALYLVGLQKMIYFSGFVMEDAEALDLGDVILERPFVWPSDHQIA